MRFPQQKRKSFSQSDLFNKGRNTAAPPRRYLPYIMTKRFSLFNKGSKAKEDSLDTPLHIPRHIAFIMDGNGRWAKRRMLPRHFGHSKGAEVFRGIVRYCGDIGIEHITVYAFSTENWKRPKEEVDAIMALLSKFVNDAFTDIVKDKFRIVFLGDKQAFPQEMQERMIALEKESSVYKRILNVALNYGGRDEIVTACNKLIAEGKTEVTEELISSKLYTHLSPDPDLIVRTAGEYRISNFLLWQCAYSEFYFTDKYWPDITHKDVDLAILSYSKRDRRFGGVNSAEKADNNTKK